MDTLFFVYILFSVKFKIFYIGHTNDLADRFHRHNAGSENFTAKFRPWICLIAIPKSSKSLAYQLELKLKNLSRKRLIVFISKHASDSAHFPPGSNADDIDLSSLFS